MELKKQTSFGKQTSTQLLVSKIDFKFISTIEKRGNPLLSCMNSKEIQKLFQNNIIIQVCMLTYKHVYRNNI